ncbi:MAG: methyltransferase domain-containing protein [Nanoarchaeota archaeon]
MTSRTGEYKEKGDYHTHLDKNWKYYPIYIEKMKHIHKILDSIGKRKAIVDLGCGEGLLVQEYRARGYNIIGLDYNYGSKHVTKGNILAMPFADRSFDVVLLLDVLEHFEFSEQYDALREIHRILKKGGIVVLSLPNLAHLASRLSFLVLGKPIRTAIDETRHKGDRAIAEYVRMLRKQGFSVEKKKGIFPTYPLISAFTMMSPSKSLPLHRAYNRLVAVPDWSFLVIVQARKK